MTLGNQWTQSNAENADQWAKQMPPSPERDWAVLGLIACRSRGQSDDAKRLLPLLQSPEVRRAAIMTIAAQLLQQDGIDPFKILPPPAAVRAWMLQQQLTTAQRADVEAAVQAGLHGAFKPDGGWTGKP